MQEVGENTVARFTYTYDAAGNRTTAIEEFNQDADANNVIDQAQKFTWTYDGLNRLTVETFDSGEGSATLGTDTAKDYVTRYTFDLASNRKLVKKMTGSHDNAPGGFSADESIEYTYDENDRLVAEVKYDHNNSANDRNTQYSYNNTLLTIKTVLSGSVLGSGSLQEYVTNTYDATGRMVSTHVVTTTRSTLTEYEYNDVGLRVKATETVDSGTPVVTVYHFDNHNHTGYAQVLEQAVDANDNGRVDAGELDHADARTFTLGHDVIAQYAGTIAAGELLAFLYDLHGSTRALIDTAVATKGRIKNDTAGGKGVQAFTYDAYGNLVDTAFGAETQADALTSLLYSGEFTHAATGQQYLRARFYDPTTGRFNRLDPYAGSTSDPLSLHKYLYAHGNPVMGVDPSGKFTIIELQLADSIRNFIAAMYEGVLGGALAAAEGAALGLNAQQAAINYVLDTLLAPVDLVVGVASFLMDTVEMGAVYLFTLGTPQVAMQDYEPTASAMLLGAYYKLKTKVGYQRHHLNQKAAFDSVIPGNQGTSTYLSGDVNSPGTEHFNVHLELERFWEPNRQAQSTPTIAEYNKAMRRGFLRAGFDRDNVRALMHAAQVEQLRHNLRPDSPVPKVPGRIQALLKWL